MLVEMDSFITSDVGRDERYYRPAEVNELLGDAEKAQKKLAWLPEIFLEEMIDEMINFDLNEAKKELFLKENDF